MVRSRRPELEKDNPVAPQPYVGPRSRRKPSPQAVSRRAQARTEAETTLLALLEAAEVFITVVPRARKTDKARTALVDAITQAQWLLSVEQAEREEPAGS